MHAIRNTLIVILTMLSGAFTARGETDIVLGEGRQPQVMVGPTGDVFVVHANDGKVRVHASTDAGKSFGKAVLVDTVSGLPLGMRRGPRIAATKDTVAITAISGEKGGGKDGDVFAWVSMDRGLTWKKSAKPLNSVAGSAREAMHGMAGGADGKLVCVWLDLRNARPGKPGTEIWCATSSDGGKNWSQDRLVYRNLRGTVCECCHPSVVIDDKGIITVMFRNALDGARDMFVATSKDGGKTFAAASKLGIGSWSLSACPMDGGALTTLSGTVTTLWRRDKTIYLTAPDKPEKPVARGTQPAVAATTKGFYFIWMDGKGLMMQAPGQTPAVFSKTGSYPTIACAPDGQGPVIAAWEQDGKVLVRMIVTR